MLMRSTRGRARSARAALLLSSGLSLAAGLSAAPGEASADTMDPALARLVVDASCRTGGPGGAGAYYNPASGFTRCQTDDIAFAKLVAQYGFAFAPPVMHSARTTGYGGFEITFEGNLSTIDASADYWRRGTEGPVDEASNLSSIENRSPDSLLQVYGLKFRKGFPFGLEIATAFGHMPNTSMWTTGADVRLALLEGFRTGLPSFLPDIAAGGAVRTVMGSEEMQLTVLGVDGQISKPFPIAGTVILTPYVGYQYLRIFGDSGLVDLTPNTDAVNLCGYTGPNTPATPDPDKLDRDGQPVCTYGSSADFNNTVIFDAVRLNRHRGVVGAQFRVQMVRFGFQAAFDLVSPEDANEGSERTVGAGDTARQVNPFEGVDRQFAFGFDLGAIF